MAWSAELHYTATANNADSVSLASGDTIGDPNNDLSVLNGTVGAHTQIGQTLVTTAYSFPLGGDDRVFDGEFRLLVNRNF